MRRAARPHDVARIVIPYLVVPSVPRHALSRVIAKAFAKAFLRAIARAMAEAFARSIFAVTSSSCRGMSSRVAARRDAVRRAAPRCAVARRAAVRRAALLRCATLPHEVTRLVRRDVARRIAPDVPHGHTAWRGSSCRTLLCCLYLGTFLHG